MFKQHWHPVFSGYQKIEKHGFPVFQVSKSIIQSRGPFNINLELQLIKIPFKIRRSEGFPLRDIFVPVRVERRAWPGNRVSRHYRRRHLEIQVDIQARKLYLKVFLWFWGRGERYLEMETGVLHRISMRTS